MITEISRKQIRLRLVLFCGFILVALIPMSILDLSVQHTALKNEFDAVEEKHLLVAQNLTNALSRYSMDVVTVFNLLATNTSNASNGQFDDTLSRFHFESVLLINKNTNTTTLIYGKLHDVQNINPILENAYSNNLVDKTTFGSLIFNSQNKPVIPLIHQISDNSFLFGTLNTSYIIELQQAISFGENGHAAIVDHSGQVIAHPSEVWQNSKKNIAVIAPVKHMMAGQTGVSTFYSPAMDKEMIAGYSVVPETGWGAMIPQPVTELEERATSIRYISNVIFAVAILLAIVFSLMLAIWLSRPLLALANAARSVTSGNLANQVKTLPALTPSEVTDVADAFNTMIDTISTKQQEITANTSILQATMNNMAEGVVLIDKDRNIQLNNDQFLVLLDISNNAQLTSTKLLEALHQAGHSPSGITNLVTLLDSQLENISNHNSMAEVTTVSKRTLEFRCGLLPDQSIVLTCIDVTERKQAELRIQYLANHDSLTHLPNRHAFDEALQSKINTQSQNASIPLIYLDLDLFKEVNDSLGHGFGDLLLIEVSNRLAQIITPNEIVARFGGDEFALLLEPGSNAEYASSVAKIIIDELSSPYFLDNQEVFIRASIGIVLFPEHGITPRELLKKVDLAMYSAKADQSGSYKFYSPEMEIELNSRKENESKLRKALVNQELDIYYQPIFDTATKNMVAAEALIRWQREDQIILPAEILPIAEQSGLIVPINNWCLRTVVSQIKQWQSQAINTLPISVNLSATLFKQPGLSKLFFNILEEFNVEPSLLIVEITENVAIATENTVTVLDELTHLSKGGIKIAMDDFGTGYSSLGHLKNFPVDYVKIDKSFTWSIDSDRDDTLIVTAILQLCEHLQLTPIAEGVETQQQLDFLKEEGCTLIQGFYFEPALTCNEFEVLLKKKTVK